MQLAHNADMSTQDRSAQNASCCVAVVMERVALNNPWVAEQWGVTGVVCNDSPAGTPHRVIVQDDKRLQLLFPGQLITLHRDEAEGYFLNITSPQPKVFILWRMHDGIARPELLTVSYNEGARWMDGGESVDGVALPVELLPWIGAFVEQHYRPEPKKKRRYTSNKDKGVGFRG